MNLSTQLDTAYRKEKKIVLIADALLYLLCVSKQKPSERDRKELKEKKNKSSVQKNIATEISVWKVSLLRILIAIDRQRQKKIVISYIARFFFVSLFQVNSYTIPKHLALTISAQSIDEN